MKPGTSLAFVLASLALLALSSCIWQQDEVAQIGKDYTPSYEEDDFYYYNGGEAPGYLLGSVSLMYGYSYYHGPRYECPICHGHPCSGHSGRASSWAHRNTSGSNAPLYVHKSGGTHGGASEAHPKEWFTSRGYAPSRLEKTDNHGQSAMRNDHDSDDRHGSLKSHSLSPAIADRVKSEVHSSNGGGSSNFSLGGSGHSSSSSSDHGSSSKRDDDSSGKKH